MFMRYHWGLGIGHQYTHSTVSTDSQFHSASPKPCPTSHDIEISKYHFDDEIKEGDDLADSTRTLELDFEPESGESDQSSDLESVLGDHVDMYGCSPDMETSTAEYYEF